MEMTRGLHVTNICRVIKLGFGLDKFSWQCIVYILNASSNDDVERLNYRPHLFQWIQFSRSLSSSSSSFFSTFVQEKKEERITLIEIRANRSFKLSGNQEIFFEDLAQNSPPQCRTRRQVLNSSPLGKSSISFQMQNFDKGF